MINEHLNDILEEIKEINKKIEDVQKRVTDLEYIVKGIGNYNGLTKSIIKLNDAQKAMENNIHNLIVKVEELTKQIKTLNASLERISEEHNNTSRQVALLNSKIHDMNLQYDRAIKDIKDNMETTDSLVGEHEVVINTLEKVTEEKLRAMKSEILAKLEPQIERVAVKTSVIWAILVAAAIQILHIVFTMFANK